MERQDGHFFNWYDIDTLTPLNPRYISAADSGNLVASLWTVDRAIEHLSARACPRPQLAEGPSHHSQHPD